MVTEPDTDLAKVWIVLEEDRLDNQIRGVFSSMEEADALLEELAAKWPDATFAYGAYPIGMRF